MLRKFLPLAGAMVLALAHAYLPPAEALPLHLDAAARTTHADTIFVRRHWRSLRHRQQQQTGIAVFIIPGLYWGPAWWDPAYAKLCWKKIRCRDCENNWIYVC